MAEYFKFNSFDWLNGEMDGGLTAPGKKVYVVGYQQSDRGNGSDANEFRTLVSENGSFVSNFINAITNNSHFQNNIQQIINEGDINIDIPFATKGNIGGILSDTHKRPSHSGETAIQARFVPSGGGYMDKTYGIAIPPYNLAITGEQIIDAINGWYEDNPDEPGIDIPFATTTKIGGILSDKHYTTINRQTAAQVRFVPSGGGFTDRTYGTSIPENNLAITGKQIIDAINGWHEDNPNEPSIDPSDFDITQFADALFKLFRHSPTIKRDWLISEDPAYQIADKPRLSIWGGNNPNVNGGKFLRLKTEKEINELPPVPPGEEPYSESRNWLDWVDLKLNTLVDVGIDSESLTDGQVLVYNNGVWTNGAGDGDGYPVLSSGSLSKDEYVINGGGSDKTLLNGNGVWTSAPPALGLIIGNGFVGINTYGARDGQALFYDANTSGVKWATPEGSSYPVLSPSSTSDEEYVVRGSGSAKTILRGDGVWIGTSASGGLALNNDGIGIYTGGATNGQVLGYDANVGTVKWVNQSASTMYKAGVGIDITDNAIRQNIANARVATPTETAHIMQIIGDRIGNVSQVKIYNGRELIATVNEYSLAEINIFDDITTIDISRIQVSNNPIYLKVHNNTGQIIRTGGSFDYIGQPEFGQEVVLVTIQFGVMRFEDIHEGNF